MEGVATVDELLNQMSQAMQARNYKGRFTYEYGGQLDTVEIVHAVRDGVEHERLQHLSGPNRDVVRKGRPVNCVNAGGFLMRGGVFASPHTLGNSPVSLNQHYQFFIRGEERIAGRMAAMVQIAPKDNLRYGLTLAIDKASGLPLMWLTTNVHNKVLERLQFIELQVEPKIDDKELQPGERHLDIPTPASLCKRESLAPQRWSLGWLPPGFLLAQTEEHQGGQALTYTDGLASFTLRITPAQPEQKLHSGIAVRGATLALLSGFSSNGQPFNVVLTGEIPPETAQAIVSRLQDREVAPP